jgi:predicted nucleotide-binding protein
MPGWSKEQVIEVLRNKSWYYAEAPIQNGTRFNLVDGTTVNHYPQRGNVTVQGKATAIREECKKIFEQIPTIELGAEVPVPPPHQPSISDDVFIVYGHDTTSRDALELILHRWRLNPIILQRLPAAGDTIIEKLETYIGSSGKAGFACVLLTPDDQGYKADRPEEIKYRARQNVILELGMVLSKLGRRRVAILHKQSIELPSDIAGLIYIPFEENISEVESNLLRELRAAGYNPQS